MKNIYVIAVAFLASWSVCTANEDQQSAKQIKPQDDILTACPYPDINPTNMTTNIAHESDCTKFYKCLLGTGTEQQCPLMIPGDETKRLHYNRALQVCDWPWNAGCDLCPPEENGEYPDESRIQDPESTNCREYIICKSNGRQERGTCKKGTCFSRTCQDCVVDREDGNCGNRPTPTRPSTKPTTPKCEVGDRKGHECNCGKFYECSDDEDWELDECEDGLHFSPSTWECTTPDKAKCKLLLKK